MNTWFVILILTNAYWGNGEIESRYEFTMVWNGDYESCQKKADAIVEMERTRDINLHASVMEPKVVSPLNPRFRGGVQRIADHAGMCIPFESPKQIKDKLAMQWNGMAGMDTQDNVLEWWGPDPKKVMTPGKRQ